MKPKKFDPDPAMAHTDHPGPLVRQGDIFTKRHRAAPVATRTSVSFRFPPFSHPLQHTTDHWRRLLIVVKRLEKVTSLMMEGNVRRLPSWMVGATGSADGGRNNANSEDKLATTRLNNKKKDNKLHKENVELEERPISKRRANGRKRKENLWDVNDGVDNGDNDEDDDGIQRKKKKKQDRLQKGVVRKPSMKGCAGGGSGCGEHIQMKEDEDAELTVEDLVSIAKEYVKADQDAMKEQSVDREHESQREVTETHSSLKVSEASLCLRVPDNEREKTASDCSAEASKSEQSLLSTIRTGDPALDMLDLFLGPLLKKPVEEEKKTEFILEDLDFAHHSIRQSQNDTREEIVPPMKKKSSFKDKVSSFLD